MMKMQVKACGQNVFVGVEQRESEREREIIVLPVYLRRRLIATQMPSNTHKLSCS